MRAIGRKPSVANPHLCTACQNALIKYHGGAEVTGTMLFADIRGSTALAERMSPSEFKALMERFYGVASRAVIRHEGAIDKFVGDELIAFFYPALAGERHVSAAIGAAQELLRETGHEDPGGALGAGRRGGAHRQGLVRRHRRRLPRRADLARRRRQHNCARSRVPPARARSSSAPTLRRRSSSSEGWNNARCT